jgi:hypothetical protein
MKIPFFYIKMPPAFSFCMPVSASESGVFFIKTYHQHCRNQKGILTIPID